MSAHRNYPLLLASQFLSAFGDNAILAVIIGQLAIQQRAGDITQSQLGMASAIYTSLLFVPYVVLAPLVGYLNDRYAKTRWLMGGNWIKICGTAVAGASVWYGPWWQGIGYFVVGVGACVYSPAKYGILPEILPRERLVKANGTVELLTLVAILTGNIGGAKMTDVLSVPVCYGILLAIYGGSFGLNLLMVKTPDHPEVTLGHSFGEFNRNFRDLMTNPRLFRVLCGTCTFWICGAVMKMNFPAWGLNVLHLRDNTQIALLGLWLSLGIMGGSVLAGQLHAVGELGWTRRYGWALAAWLGVLGLVEAMQAANWVTHRWPVIVMLVFSGAVAGLFLIPLNAALQAESHEDKLGKTIATQNFVDNVGMMVAGGLVFGGVKVGLNASGVFLALSVVVALIVTALKVPGKPMAGPAGLEGR